MKNLVAILLTSQSFAKANEANNTAGDQFKNQSEFIQMRNELNEASEKSHELYETLDEKLSETGYVETAALESLNAE